MLTKFVFILCFYINFHHGFIKSYLLGHHIPNKFSQFPPRIDSRHMYCQSASLDMSPI